MPKALLVDDDEGFVLGLAEAVKREGFEVRTAGTLQEARAGAARAASPTRCSIDLQLPDGSGLELLQTAEGRLPPGVIFISGNASVELAVEALRLGATDFLTKPVDFARVKMALANLSRTRELTRQVGALRGELRRLGPLRLASIGGSRRDAGASTTWSPRWRRPRRPSSCWARPAPARSSSRRRSTT